MSLQLAAQHLSSHGRGKDSTLVHMSPREVKSLNDLAMAHGGHLTINPNTGLPEAGFLESILPMVAGVALGPAGLGLTAMQAGLAGGALSMVLNPDKGLMGGIMAGLGAYGGAGLGESLAMQGVQAAATPAAADLASTGATAQQSALAQQEAIKEAALRGYSPDQAMIDHQGLAGAGANQAAQLKAVQEAALTPEAAKMKLANMTMGDRFGALGKGFGSLGQEGGISNLFQNMGGDSMGLLKTAGSALAPVAGELLKPKKQEEQKANADMGQRYGFAMNPTGGQPQQVQSGQNPPGTPQTTTPFPTPDLYGKEQRYFAPSYTKLTPEAAKSLYGYAGGGSIEAMSNANAIGANTGYPMANIQPGAYATPYQQPVSRNVISDASDTGVNPMTGEMRYADGGIAEEDRPTETPAVKMFQQMQAQRAAQAQAPQIDANAEFAKYAQQAIGAPNQLQAPPTAPATSTGLGEYGYSYNPVKQQLTQIPGTAPVESANPSANPFSIENRPIVGYTATGEKIYGEQSSNSPFGRGFGGLGRAAGGSISDAYNLGGYSDGGRLLRGPGDGVSDSIPAVIGKKQPARLADGEFVVPARIVSELGNGSTEAGARKLYAMMDRIQSARGKTVGKNKVAKNSRSEKYLPA